MFKELGIPLQKKVVFQVNDDIGSNILVGCTVAKGSSIGSKQGSQTPFGPVPGSASLSSTHTIDTLVQD